MDDPGYAALATALAGLQTAVDELRSTVAQLSAEVAPVVRLLPALEEIEHQKYRDEGAEQARADMRPVVLHDEAERSPIWKDADGRVWALAMVTRGGAFAVLVSMAWVGALNAEQIGAFLGSFFGG